MAGLLELAGYIQNQGDIGRQRGQQSVLSQLAAQSYEAPKEQRQSILSQMAGIDPEMAQTQAKQFQQSDADAVSALADKTRYFVGQVKAGNRDIVASLYPQIAQEARAAGLGDVPLEWNDSFLPGLEQLARYGQDPAQDNTPAAIRELQLLQANPELAALDMKRRTAGFDRPQLIQTADGYAWATPEGATPLNYGRGGGMPANSAPDQSAVQRNLAMLGVAPGVQMTSGLRTPQRNAEVGGKANSQHLRGTAGDYVVPQAQKAAFIQQARDAGLEAIDEGDHIHVQQPRGAGGGNAGRVMPAQKEVAPSDFERRIAMAQGMGASDDQLKQMVIGETGGGKPSATQIKLANTAKAKLIDLKAMEDQLGKVEAAFTPLKGTYSAGPGGGMLPTVHGKQFDSAVALLKGMARKLTRTPGEGAMSDYESKLAELANPSRGEYEEVTADQIQQLRALVETTRQGYEALLQDAGGNTDNLPGNSGGPQPGMVEAGYRFKGGNPADPSSWEPI